MDAETLKSFANYGGLGLMAALVYIELRAWRKEVAPVLLSIKTTLAALLERERIRSGDTGQTQIPSE